MFALYKRSEYYPDVLKAEGYSYGAFSFSDEYLMDEAALLMEDENDPTL